MGKIISGIKALVMCIATLLICIIILFVIPEVYFFIKEGDFYYKKSIFYSQKKAKEMNQPIKTEKSTEANKEYLYSEERDKMLEESGRLVKNERELIPCSIKYGDFEISDEISLHSNWVISPSNAWSNLSIIWEGEKGKVLHINTLGTTVLSYRFEVENLNKDTIYIFSCLVKSSIRNNARVFINLDSPNNISGAEDLDNVSFYHPGDGKWYNVVIPFMVPKSIKRVFLNLQVIKGEAFFDDISLFREERTTPIERVRSWENKLWEYADYINYLKDPWKKRIVCIGGSTTMGYGIPMWKTYPYTLQSILDVVKPGEFEVLNLGLAGATVHTFLDRTVNAAALGATFNWLDLKPDIVFICPVWNDYINYRDLNSQKKHYPFHLPMDKIRKYLEKSWINRFALGYYLYRISQNKFFEGEEIRVTKEMIKLEFEDNFEDNLCNLVALWKETGADVYLISLTTYYKLAGMNDDGARLAEETDVRVMSRVAEKQNIKILFPFNHIYQSEINPDELESLFLRRKEPDFYHFRFRGDWVIAECLFSEINDLQKN